MKTAPPVREQALLASAAGKGLLGKAWIYTRLSGPGWLQGAITLGGGSLTGALYLGVLFGPHLLWVQPLAMLCGVIMLAALAWVTVTTGRAAFPMVRQEISPVLAWAWLGATVVANFVWILPQYALGTAALQQNLVPSLNTDSGRWIAGGLLFAAALPVVAAYDRSGRGVKWFERILQAIVGLIVLSFLGVAVVLLVRGRLDLGAIFRGHLPDFTTLTRPVPAFDSAIAATGEHAPFWRLQVLSDQRDKIITAFGNAVGINMTFLLPASLLKRGWGREARGLALFDLAIGLIVPFVIATSCLVIAASAQFHGKTGDVLLPDGTPRPEMRAAFERPVSEFQKAWSAGHGTPATLMPADTQLAAMLANRDTAQLATALEPLTGPFIAQKVFGLGVFGMALSSIIVIMLINGFTVCDAFGRHGDRRLHLAGAILPGLTGIFAPILWTGDSRAALAVPASIVGSSLIPIAWLTFFLLMNSRKVLGADMPAGAARFRWNAFMLAATGVSTFGSVWVLLSKGRAGQAGIAALGVLAVLGIAGFLKRQRTPS